MMNVRDVGTAVVQLRPKKMAVLSVANLRTDMRTKQNLT
jgi:hypothetical protein